MTAAEGLEPKQELTYEDCLDIANALRSGARDLEDAAKMFGQLPPPEGGGLR